MFFTRETLQANARVRAHWQDLWANRNIYDIQQQNMIDVNRAAMTPEMLQANALEGLGQGFWRDVDNQIIQLRDIETGMEIVNDLMGVQTTLPVGKTARLYNMVGDIADDVSVSIDGQAPYSFDHTEYANDGDPIPMFTAGFGVNWRHAQGMNTVGVDLVLDSQEAKLKKFYAKLVSYMLDGSSRISVQGFAGQGIRNHRNTKRINLGATNGGANIDLTSALPTALMTFFSTGAFALTAEANYVDAYDVLWVSPQIWRNMARPYTIDINGGANAVITGTVLDAVKPYMNVRDVRMTYALQGNEFIAYQKRRDVITPLVGMTTGTVPLPRPMPQHNYNFQIMAAIGLQIKVDGNGRGGVVYGADFD